MRQVQAAYIGSGSAGDGTLRYRGSTWRQDHVGILRAMMIDD
jgi:hypothetical protein